MLHLLAFGPVFANEVTGHTMMSVARVDSVISSKLRKRNYDVNRWITLRKFVSKIHWMIFDTEESFVKLFYMCNWMDIKLLWTKLKCLSKNTISINQTSVRLSLPGIFLTWGSNVPYCQIKHINWSLRNYRPMSMEARDVTRYCVGRSSYYPLLQ